MPAPFVSLYKCNNFVICNERLFLQWYVFEEYERKLSIPRLFLCSFSAISLKIARLCLMNISRGVYEIPKFIGMSFIKEHERDICKKTEEYFTIHYMLWESWIWIDFSVFFQYRLTITKKTQKTELCIIMNIKKLLFT